MIFGGAVGTALPVSKDAACGSTTRICIYDWNNSTAWRIEAKLIPSDFGLQAFAGTVGVFLGAGDNTNGFQIWPPTALLNDASTWANLKLGNPADVMLVLDLSGSMQDAACTGCQPKLQVLKDAVAIFLDLYAAVAIPADRIGVTYFATNVSSYPIGGGLQSVITNSSAASTHVGNRQATGMTAMGGGLQTAINQLTDVNQQKSIVLFTDGMQNVNPMVMHIDDGAPAFHLEINDEPGRPPSGVTPTNPVTRLDAIPGIRVNTIGVGATSPFVQLLTDIANESGGKSKLTTSPDDVLRQFFIENLINSLRGNSPQLLGYRRGQVTNKPAEEVFTSNNSLRSMVFNVSWRRGDSLAVRIIKDSVDITAAADMVAREFYNVLSFHVPIEARGKPISAGGEWHVIISGRSALYEAAAIADETLLEYDVSLGPPDAKVGDALIVQARVRADGGPVPDARVSATILAPRVGNGTFVSVSANPAIPATFHPESAATPAQNKFLLLLLDRALRQKLEPAQYNVTLASNGDGTYSTTFPGTYRDGSYTAILRIEGERAGIGPYRRTERVSRFVRFGQAEFGASGVRVSRVNQTPDGRQLLLRVRPRDRFGNYVGPDYADRISVALSSGTVGTDKSDLVDGSYTIPLRVPVDSDPKITIVVMGQQLFQGQLSELERPQSALSLHGGLTFPIGSLKNSYDRGFGGTLDLERRVSERLSLAALFGYHRFDSSATTVSAPTPHLELYHVSGSLEATVVTAGPLALLADAGGGMYWFKPGMSKAGAHLGIGLEYAPSSSFALGVSARAHNVFTGGTNTRFVAIQAGGRVRF